MIRTDKIKRSKYYLIAAKNTHKFSKDSVCLTGWKKPTKYEDKILLRIFPEAFPFANPYHKYLKPVPRFKTHTREARVFVLLFAHEYAKDSGL